MYGRFSFLASVTDRFGWLLVFSEAAAVAVLEPASRDMVLDLFAPAVDLEELSRFLLTLFDSLLRSA